MSDEEQTQTKRREDLEVSFLGMKLKGSVRAVVSLLNGTIGLLALTVAVLWHDNKTVEAIWFQTLTLATPQEARAALIRQHSDKVPEVVRSKLPKGD